MVQDPVGTVEQVVDVRTLDANLSRIAPVVRVGRPEQRAPVPRNEKDDPGVVVGADHQRVLALERGQYQMDTLGQARRHRSRRLDARRQPQIPGAHAAHDGGGANLDRRLAAVEVLDARPDHAPAFGHELPRRRAVDGGRARTLRPIDDFQREPGVVRATVPEQEPALEPVRLQAGQLQHLLAPQAAVPRHRLPASGEPVVDPHPDAQPRAPDSVPAVDGEQEAERSHAVRSQACQAPALVQRLAHESQVPVLQVAQAPVDQLRGRGRGGAGPVALLDQGDPQAAQRRVVGRPRTIDAATDDEQIVRTLLQLMEATLHRTEPCVGGTPRANRAGRT